MTKTFLTLTLKQVQIIFLQLLNDKKIENVIHPADNALIFYLNDGVTIHVNGHWEYTNKNEKIISSIEENETIENNFNKIEDLAEKLAKQKPVITKIDFIDEKNLKLSFNQNNSMIISVYNGANEDQYVSINYSSTDDTTHLRYEYEKGEWTQSLLFKQ